MKYTLSVTFFYIAAYAFITGSSFVYIDYFGIPSKYYGFLFGVNILGVAALSFLNKSLVNKFSIFYKHKIALKRVYHRLF